MHRIRLKSGNTNTEERWCKVSALPGTEAERLVGVPIDAIPTCFTRASLTLNPPRIANAFSSLIHPQAL